MSKNRKRIMIFAGGTALLVAIICSVLFLINREEEYRTIQIYKIEGSATVDRGDADSIDAYEGMMIQSGDTIYTDKESYLYFKMDDDKFALLEPESTVHIEASGTSSESRTVFNLETGALVNRIDSKLNSNSVYEVNTPNSTMAVRGTVFRIEVTYDENGDSYTNVYVFDGTVECQLVFKNGSVDEETKQVQKGMMVRIHGDETISEYILDDGTVDYEQLPVEVLQFLKLAIEEGVELSISKEELEAILTETEKGEQEQTDETATGISSDDSSSDDSSQAYEEKKEVNYTGGDETDDCNHACGTEIRNSVAEDCCNAGYTGDTYCLGCGILLEKGTVIAATGNHPAAACGVNGHHAHDGKIHETASCGIAGHCVSDGLNHDIAPCNFLDHHNCDGRTHGENCFNTDSAYFTIAVIVADNGEDWSFTINNTEYKKDPNKEDGNQYYYYFQGNAGSTVTISRTGITGDFYAFSEAMPRIDVTNSLSFTLNEGEQDYQISVFIGSLEQEYPM